MPLVPGDLTDGEAATGQAFHEAMASVAYDRLDARVDSLSCDDETVRDRLSFIAFHEGYHMGALGALRKPSGTRVRRKR